MVLNETWTVVTICFGLAVFCSCCASMMGKAPPSLRQVFFGGLYTGASAVGIAFLVIHLYGLQQTFILYFTSILTGLQSVEALAAMWSQLFPAVINWLVSRFTGKSLAQEPAPLAPLPISAPPPKPAPEEP